MTTLAKYELLARIATGGMAEIHVARPRGAGRDRLCVVKKLLPQHAANEDFNQMFLDEGRIAAMFDHPNVVRMHDFGSEDGSHYLAMEYLHGEDLRSILRTLRSQGKTMALAPAVAIVAAVCAGLHHAHETRGPAGEALDIVHRDVSPHNVFVTFEGSVKVVDFGIAKSTDRGWETKHGTLKGKVPYMAPEQIKGRRLDRRADIYAVGVMLYELVLGRRPYVLATGGDFAMMMAIARHDIRPASQVDPSIAPELERIMASAMAYDAKARYASARELQVDLETFARETLLDTSNAAISAFLGGLFEKRFEEWRAAQAAESDLTAHVVQVEAERAQTQAREVDAGDATEIDEVDASVASSAYARALSAPPPGSAASLVASNSAAVAGVVEVFGVTVVTLQGRIDEAFEGRALGGSLSGTVLIDMAGVERITSFGVREWLEMTSALEANEDVDVHLARCSEAVVTQLSLVHAFAGRSKVVSFDVPFLCDDCGNAFVRSLDCEHDGAVIAAREPPTSTCPRCAGEAKLDDDPAYLAFATPFAGRAVPERVRVVLQRLDEGGRGGDAVDKVITASETRVRVHRDVDPSFRWNRVLDGLEGAIVVDFRGAPRFGREAAARFARAVGALGPECTSCEIVECPVEVAAALGSSVASGRVRVATVAFEGRCSSCAAARTGAVGASALEEAYRSRTTLFVPCRRCNGPLALGDLTAAMTALFGSLAVPPAQPPSGPLPVPVPVPVPVPASSTASLSASLPLAASRTSAVRGWLVMAGLGLSCVALGGAAFVWRSGTTRQADVHVAPRGAPSASGPTSGASDSATSEAVEHRADGVYVVVTTRVADEDRALEEARAAAIRRLLPLLERELDEPVRAAAEIARPSTDDATAVSRFVDQVGAFASPDRLDVKRRVEVGGVVLTATYRVAAPAWRRAVAHYSTTRSAGGVTFAVALPTHGTGLVVVASDAAVAHVMQVGSVVTEIDGRPATSLDVFSSIHRGRHTALLSLRGERLEAKLNVK